MNSKDLKLKHRDTIDFTKKNFGDLLYIGVSTSRSCNLKCKYCFENSSKPDSNETTLNERLDIISQAKQLGAEVLLIAGAGEPLVDENLFPMIKHAYNLKMGSLIYTNGLENKNGKIVSISNETAEFLYSHNVTVMVKMESLNPSTHDCLTNTKGSHEKVMQSIKTLRNTGYSEVEDNITRLGVAALYTKQNLKELPKLKKWCKEKNMKLCVDVLGVHGRAKNNINIVPTKQEILTIQKQMGRESGIAASGECIFWKYGIIIDHQGDARFCTEIITNDIGNIKNKTLKELLEIKNRKYPSKPGEFTCQLKAAHYIGCQE